MTITQVGGWGGFFGPTNFYVIARERGGIFRRKGSKKWREKEAK